MTGQHAGMIHVVELGQAEKLGMEDMVRGTASGIHNQSHSAFKLWDQGLSWYLSKWKLFYLQ